MGHTPAMQPDAIRHDFAEVNGIRLHYASAGAGKLIIFLHGFPEFWYAWRKQLAEFGRDFLAVAPDMRGYNLSSTPADVAEYDMAKLVGDIRALAEHLAAKKFYLVGHDWGGVVAWATAMAFPEAVEKLVIINAPHPIVFRRELRENPAQQQASEYMTMFRSPQAEALITANNFANFQEHLLGELLRKGHFSEEDRRQYLEAWSQPGAITGGLNYYRAAQAGPPEALLGEAFDATRRFPSLNVKAPTLVIWGEKDPYLLAGNLKGLEEYVPNLKIERFADATHWVVHEKTAEVNSLIRRFLAG
ncbi:MAG TPA: alpha/beta hydrolase [Candidatus Limnocylindrales bacterium]|nr:alpha/beta hydrolase [Candidatus Limnocylindrales bacterium]